MAEVTIRRYRRRDRSDILRITDESFGGFCLASNMEEHFGRIAGSDWRQRKRAAILYDLKRNPKHCVVAEVDGELVGYCCTRLYKDLKTGHIANMAVDRLFQSRGIGKKLMQAALEHFREAGMEYARIETMEQNEAGKHLYPAFGFKEVGRQIFFFREL
jgi:ribosomal protein S18 acetylase RimI-like enzyme